MADTASAVEGEFTGEATPAPAPVQPSKLYGDAMTWMAPALSLMAQPVDTRRSEAALGARMAEGERLRADRTKMYQQRADEADAIERTQTMQRVEREAARPGALTLPPAPSMQARGFADPGPNASMLQQLQSVMLGAGLIAQQIGGLKGNATAAVSALRGAFQGWAEGDRERANRELTAWEAETKKLLAEHRDRVQAYRDLVEDQKTSWSEKMALLRVRAQNDEWKAMSDASAVEDWNKAIDVYGRAEDLGMQQRIGFANALLKVGEHRERIAESRLRQQEAIDARAEAARLAREQQLTIEKMREADRAGAREDAANLRRELQANQQAMMLAMEKMRMAEKGEEPASGVFYDKASGRVRAITKAEEKGDLAKVKDGADPTFKKLTTADQNLVERLVVARPIVDRLDQLVDKINAVAPGQNITTGLIKKLERVAGIGEDIQQLRNLSVEAGTEITAALSQGQPRVTIFKMVMGEIEPKETQTWSVAKQQVQTMRTTLQNRITAATGDPKGFDRLSSGLQPYAEAPKPGGAGAKIRVKRKSDGVTGTIDYGDFDPAKYEAVSGR